MHAATARQIVRDPHFKGEVQVVNFTPITSMYGAVHCSSQVSPAAKFSLFTFGALLLEHPFFKHSGLFSRLFLHTLHFCPALTLFTAVLCCRYLCSETFNSL